MSHVNYFRLSYRFVPDSDNEVSKQKLSSVPEELRGRATPVLKQSDIESESATDDIEILEKPERSDIEKKLE